VVAAARPLDGAALAAAADLAPRALETTPPALAAALAALAARAGAAFLAAALLLAAFLALSASLKPAAGLKRMPFEAAIFTGAPVRGLRPVRALRCVGLKLPKPYRVTFCPDRTWSSIVPTKASTASSACRLDSPVVFAISSINWDRFNATSWGMLGKLSVGAS
jgi:hypothetical protein